MNKFRKMSAFLMVGIIAISSLPMILISCNKNNETNQSPEEPSSDATKNPIDKNPETPQPKVDDSSKKPDKTESTLPTVIITPTSGSGDTNTKPPILEIPAVVPPAVVPPKVINPDEEKLPTETKPIDPEFAKGGSISYNGSSEKLIVNKYLPIVTQLNINEYTNTSKLTNKNLNDKLHEHSEYKELNVEIGGGSSQRAGTLFLKLSGNYGGTKIEDAIISISNFPTFGFALRMNSSVNIDKNKLIENLKNESNLRDMNMATFFAINNPNNLWVLTKTNEVPLNLLTLYQNGFLGRITISNPRLTGEDWNISIAFNYQEYDAASNSWRPETSQTQHLFGYKVNLDINQAALDYLTSHATIENNNNASIFASGVFLKERKGLSRLEDYVKVDQKVYKFYFGDDTKWSDFQVTSNGDLRPNDVKGILEGDFSLTITNSDNGKKYVSSLLSTKSIRGFKTTGDIFTKDALSSNNNYIVVGEAFQRAITTDLKTPQNKKILSTLKVGESHNFKAKELPRSFGRSTLEPGTLLFNNNYNESEDVGGNNYFGDLQSLKTSGFSLHILGITSDSLLELLAHNRDGAINGMLVKWIMVGLNDSDSVVVNKTNNGLYNISSKLKISIDLFGATQEITLSTADIAIEERHLR